MTGPIQLDRRALDDLVTFAHLEVDSGDIEPWAAVLAHLHATGVLNDEQTAWAVKLYNATDTFGTGFAIMAAASSPRGWAKVAERERQRIARLPISGERRNLRGGRLLRHLDDYVGWVGLEGDGRQLTWLNRGIPEETAPRDAWGPLMSHLRLVWGTGRLSAFEWAEFVGKTGLVKVEAPDACLWESSGPRESLSRLYGLRTASRELLDHCAEECRAHLAAHGVDLPWWDFETVICDFNVMRKGRYYPGRHLGMIREEIDDAPPEWRDDLDAAWNAVVPAPWSDVDPGDRKDLRPIYAHTGRIITPLGAAS